ncbi:MAG: helicase-associated domain-containing protein [Candidatus Hydrogenedentes bacterium]|nr:helicase-associated domain-containing protein [Candidatus Hydrogenedentota bacterium]
MRYGLSLLSCFEEMDRKAFEMALELTINSKGGLTSHYLASKLSVKEEEIEYIYKHNYRLFFHDLNRIKVVPEAIPLVKRVQKNLTTNGDVNYIFETLNSLSAIEKREIERRFYVNKVMGKMSLGMEVVEKLYKTPLAVVDFVARQHFSNLAREIFDYVWDSKTGVVSLNQLRQRFKERESEIEEALEELIKNFVLFELFRYNGQDRLVRYVGLIAEIRQLRDNIRQAKDLIKQPISPVKIKASLIESQDLNFAKKISRIVANALLKPLRLSQDGQIHKSDEQRILKTEKEDAPPSLHLCVWFAEKLRWLKQEGDYLIPNNIEHLLNLNLVQRQKILFEFYTSSDEASPLLKTILQELQALKSLTWYPLRAFASRVHARYIDEMKYTLSQESGNSWIYRPVGGKFSEETCINIMETYLFWLGIIDLCQYKDAECFRISELGHTIIFSNEGLQSSETFSENVEIVVQHNFEIIVPTDDIDPLKLAIIEVFAQKKSEGKLSVYSISRESFLKGIQRGVKPELFLRILQEHTNKKKLPDLVISTINQWTDNIKRVKIKKVILVETDSPITALELLNRKKLVGLLLPPQDNQLIVENYRDTSELKAMIEKEGFIVEP